VRGLNSASKLEGYRAMLSPCVKTSSIVVFGLLATQSTAIACGGWLDVACNVVNTAVKAVNDTAETGKKAIEDTANTGKRPLMTLAKRSRKLARMPARPERKPSMTL
jgi:hypothetical protein